METRPPPSRRHGSEIIGKTSPPIQVERAPPVFALHPYLLIQTDNSRCVKLEALKIMGPKALALLGLCLSRHWFTYKVSYRTKRTEGM
ncbi:hypothetical protein Hdeb2414_s0006g00223911 [Helianthus debilis subsp. tardiflorus]